MNLPADLSVYGPSFLCDLLDGLEGIDGSLYRAWMLQHGPKPDKGDKRHRKRRLGYLSYSQDSSLLLDMANTLESLRVMLAKYMGDKNAKPDMILPPGAEDDGGKRSLNTSGMSIAQISGMLHGTFGGSA